MMNVNFRRLLSVALVVCMIFTSNLMIYADPNTSKTNLNEEIKVTSNEKDYKYDKEGNIFKEYYDKDGRLFIAYYNKDGKIEKVVSPTGDELYYGTDGKPNKIITSDGKVLDSSDSNFISAAATFVFVLPLIAVAIVVIEEVIMGIGAVVITTNLIEQAIYYTDPFPSNHDNLDSILGVSHNHIPDGPETPNRKKAVWRLKNGYEVVYEQHPYDIGTPISHAGPHYHINTPNGAHLRYLVGGKIPKWVFDFLLYF